MWLCVDQVSMNAVPSQATKDKVGSSPMVKHFRNSAYAQAWLLQEEEGPVMVFDLGPVRISATQFHAPHI